MWFLKCLVVSSVIFDSLQVCLNHTAFCSFLKISSIKGHRIFPLSNPPLHIPWVWDAIYDATKATVELTVVSRQACSFKKDEWRRIVELFPQYSHQLAYGNDSNILICADEMVNRNKAEYPFFTRSDQMNLGVNCVFLMNGTVVQKVRSVSNKLSASSAIGTIAVTCATPLEEWNSMQIERNMNEMPAHTQQTYSYDSIVTESFPVCRIPEYNPLQKQYELSVCTATANSDRKHLVEWIEYHLLQG